MVQIWNAPQKPKSPMEGLAEGLGQGIANVTSMGLQMRMQEMMESKKEARQYSKVLRTAQQLAQNDPAEIREQMTGQYAALGMIKPEMMFEYSQQSAANKLQAVQDMQQHDYDQMTPQIGAQKTGMQTNNKQTPQNAQYPMQTGYNAQGPQSAIHSTNVNPIVFPYRQEQLNQMGQVNGPSGQVGAEGQQTGAAPAEMDRFQTVKTIRNGKIIPTKMVKSLEDAQNLAEARPYIQHFYPRGDWEKAERKWMDLQTLATRQEKGGIEKQRFQGEKRKEKIERFKPIISKNIASGEEAKKLIPSLKVAIQTNEKMKTSPATWDSLVSSSNNTILNSFKSKDAQVLEAQAPVLMASLRGKMGGVLTDAKINLISKKIAGVSKDKNANRLLLYSQFFENKLSELEEEATNNIIEENGGLIPVDFDKKLKKSMSMFIKQADDDLTLMINDKMPSTGMDLGKKFDSIPPASQSNAGRTARNEKTGKRYVSDGSKWTEIK